jgi:peptidoglycan hydrolase-like protein with peptidoglycan-binding domain
MSNTHDRHGQVGETGNERADSVAPGKRARTDGMAVQRRTAGTATESPAAPAPRAVAAGDDPFGLHLIGAPVQMKEDKEYGGTKTDKDDSARFEGDKALEEIHGGAKTVKSGGRGLPVTKLQQALIDLGYLLPKHGVDGKFEGETRIALLAFQKDAGVTESGEFDAETSKALHTKYDTRKPYVDRAKHDAADPGTRTLGADDKKAAIDAMVPAKGAGGAPAVFTEDHVDGKYGARILDRLTKLIAHLHKDLHDDKIGLRADPAANFHDWSTLEGPAKGAKEVTDALYDTNYGGAAAFPAMTHAGGNLIDQWEDELSINSGLTAPQKKTKAEHKVWYLINSNCAAINKEHGAVPSATKEKGILKPIVDDFIATAPKVQTLLDLDVGWEGAQLDGVVYLQRYKSGDPDKKAAKEKDRVQMWELFNTCIHEYLHTLAHPDYQAWAQSFKTGGDETRYNTLIEGFCDFFTLNVRSTVTPDAKLQAQVEGPYANGNPPAKVKSGVYPSHRQAEQVVSIVGIKNAQAGYFRGQTALMGKT